MSFSKVALGPVVYCDRAAGEFRELDDIANGDIPARSIAVGQLEVDVEAADEEGAVGLGEWGCGGC